MKSPTIKLFFPIGFSLKAKPELAFGYLQSVGTQYMTRVSRAGKEKQQGRDADADAGD